MRWNIYYNDQDPTLFEDNEKTLYIKKTEHSILKKYKNYF